MGQRIKIRRDTSANWTSSNPILADGELAYDKTNKLIKIGDGLTAYNSLPRLTPLYFEQTRALGVLGATSVAHGLGIKPKSMEYGLRCLTADLGYAVGDELLTGLGGVLTASCNATNARLSTTATLPSVNNGSTGSSVAITTAANWQWFVRVSA